MISFQHRFMNRFGVLIGLMGAFAGAPLAGAQAQAPAKTAVSAITWLPVTTGKLFGISGMALVEDRPATPTVQARRQFLVVHDNKNAGENRLSLLTILANKTARYTQLAWPTGTALPVDLEALAAVPDHPGAFMVLASDGLVTELQLSEAHNAVQVTTSFKLPNYKEGVRANFEGFSLARLGATPIAVWAYRGSNDKPAALYYSTLDLDTNTFGPVSTASLTAPWPTAPTPAQIAANPALDVRSVSDLKLYSAGALIVSSSSDGGDDGPFSSAIYLAGSFNVVDGKPQWNPSENPWIVRRYTDHKIEGFDLVPGALGGIAVGTDDENQGAFVAMG